MIKGKVLLGLVAGFSVGTILGALFGSGRRDKTDAQKADKDKSKDKDEVVVKY